MKKKTLSETILSNLLTEREMAIASKNGARLKELQRDIEIIKRQIADEKCGTTYG